MTAPELKPCPFCGVKLQRPREGLNYRHTESDCIFGDRVFTLDQIAAWNTRTDTIPDPMDDPRVVALVEALLEALVWDSHDETGVPAVWLGQATDALEALSAITKDPPHER